MSQPSTQYELTGEWSSLDHEAAFLGQIADETEARLTVAGLSDQGRNIYRLDLGNPAGTTWVILVHVHAREAAARESALAFMRDLAYSSDPAVLEYLNGHRVVLISPISPDAHANGTRYPAEGDINRDYLTFNTAPARVVAETLRDIDPHLVVDGHEQSVSGTATDMEFFGIGTLAVHPGLRSITDQATSALQAGLRDIGYTCEPYPDPGRVSGREASAFHHAASILLESYISGARARRVACYEDSLKLLRQWHHDNAEALADAKRASRAAALEGEPSPYILQTGVTAPGGAWPVTELPIDLDGYAVAGRMPRATMDAYGVQSSGNWIPLNQWARAVVPLLFDPDSDDALVEAERVIAAEGGEVEGGLTVPFAIDAATVSGSLEIVTEGNAASPAVVRIDGPVQFPEVRHEQSGAELVFDLLLDEGQWLEVDLADRTVMLNGQASRRGRMRGRWFDLAPGVNTISFNAGSHHPDARLTITWRDAYR